MGEQRNRSRITSKIDQLPETEKENVNDMLLDTSCTYQEISDFLLERGYEISKSAVGRYAIRSNSVTKRLMDAQEQTKAIVDTIRKNPDADYTEGALQIMAGELTRKIAMAQEEWDELPIEKAAKIMVSLSRTKVYKDKVRAELQERLSSAIDAIKAELKKELAEHPDVLKRLNEILNETAAAAVENE